ncbi:DUF72 domain-containing protein [Alteromonas sp. BMJM2]|uniref:DUF72 domain-containing protein n=1 Tax=Alteromonas sp. BMJM2 TaxID=2954241 RepID=UPI0022B524A4|nr:DUF72 domain-containing protein [Alteromonas sp. BMJM2]
MTNMNNTATNMVNAQQNLPPVFIGLPMWQHSHWPNSWFASFPKAQSQLIHYANECNTVEGNTTFYSLPDADAVARWADSVPSHFSFAFKFNQQITHVNQLRHCEDEIRQQLSLLAPLKHKLGVMMVQLPASFGPDKLSVLDTFLSLIPTSVAVAVEVRHLQFFAKSEAEKAFNQLLIKHKANRIIMDTRALFTGPVTSEIVREVRGKKPKVPVNVIATGQKPVVRFVGNDSEEDNTACLRPWVSKIHQWRIEGKSPYFFCHRPDNKDAPWLASLFIAMYNEKHTKSPLPTLSITKNPKQDTLF